MQNSCKLHFDWIWFWLFLWLLSRLGRLVITLPLVHATGKIEYSSWWGHVASPALGGDMHHYSRSIWNCCGSFHSCIFKYSASSGEVAWLKSHCLWLNEGYWSFCFVDVLVLTSFYFFQPSWKIQDVTWSCIIQFQSDYDVYMQKKISLSRHLSWIKSQLTCLQAF